jgi:YfiR/HmsC-like
VGHWASQLRKDNMRMGHYIRKQQKGWTLVLLLMLLCLPASLIRAQATDVPISLQVPLAVKALSYAKTLPTKLVNGKLVIGVVYQEKFRRSYTQMEELVEAFSKEKASTPIQMVRVPVGDDGQPLQSVQWKNLSCVYFTTLRAATPATILSATRPLRLVSFSTEPDAAKTYVTMAFELVGGRAKIAINRAKSDEEQCEFSSQLLKLAVIY